MIESGANHQQTRVWHGGALNRLQGDWLKYRAFTAKFLGLAMASTALAKPVHLRASVDVFSTPWLDLLV